jgi:hypothetical protein
MLVRGDPNYFKFYGNILGHVMAVNFRSLFLRNKAQETDIRMSPTCIQQLAYWGGGFF